MSYSYWGIVGYGVCIDDITKYIDNEKVNLKVRELSPNETFEEDVFEDDTFCGCPYNNFAEFLSELDDTNVLTWEDGGNSGKCFLMYSPKYPWQMNGNEPQSYEEIETRIVNALRKVCKQNISAQELKAEINHISDYGCG